MKLVLQGVAVIGFLLVATAGFTYVQSAYFVSRAKLTTGVVVGISTSVDQDTNSILYCPQISYITKTGQTVKFSANTCTSPSIYNIGDVVNMYYDPQNPQDAQIKSFGAQYLLTTSYFVAGLPLVLIGFLGLWLQKRRERASQISQTS